MPGAENDIKKKIYLVQEKWAKGIVDIGTAYMNKEDFVNLTEKFIANLYFFGEYKILFKPTKASKIQFRRRKNEFLSYFVGYNKVSDEDKGFALEPWKEVKFEPFDFCTYGDFILSIGNYSFINYNNIQTKVEYSFGYVPDKNGQLRIVFHHSSLPFKS